MVKKILAVLAGVLAGGLVIFLVERIAHSIYPPPEWLDPAKPETIARYVDEAPVATLLFVLLSWALGSLAGGITATLVCNDRKSVYALTAGTLLLLLGIVNLIMIPHPPWFMAVTVFVYIPPAWLGYRLVRKKGA